RRNRRRTKERKVAACRWPKDFGAMNLAAKDIRHNVGRFALTTLGIGMLLMVVMGMGGIFRGLVDDATLLVNAIGGDLWIVQSDTRGPLAEVSRVPSNLVHRAAAVPGVETSREFVYHTIQREHNGRAVRIALLGLSWPTDKGDWLPLVSGRPLRQNHFELIADRSLGLELGSQMKLGNDTYKVVGTTANMMSSSGDGMAFVTVADALAIQFDTSGEAVRLEREARRARGANDDIARRQPALLENAFRPTAEIPGAPTRQISGVVVTIRPDFDVEQVAATIAAWGDVTVYTSDAQKDLLLEGMIDKVRRQIGLFRVLLTVIAAIIMALILYTLTLDKIHSIALLKLIGAPNKTIIAMILQQALVLGVLGYGIAYFVGQRLFPLFPRRVILTQFDLIQLAVVVLIISVLASLLGIWKALSVSPNEAISG
ncbi:MAG: ABC transporter permease, partial [Planctomycetales bacterium]|nr:ABC transporter permease [Planctomycetales bacterium]